MGRRCGIPRNVELKARLGDLAGARRTLSSLGAQPGPVEEQVDTYFRVPAGRLKLREIPGFDSELIFYDRDESGGTRQCAYEIYRHQPSPELKGLLVAGLGELARVAKRREVHWLGRTKINLDMVEGLGEFIEFEVPVEDNTQAAESRIRELKEAFSITEDRTVGCSYSDLVGRSR